jgi:hypothetical protein
LDSANRVLTFVDTFDTACDVSLRLSWHLGPGVLLDLDGVVATLTWRLGRDRRSATLLLPDALVWSAHTGETDPPLGWYSPRFGRRGPATSLVGRGTGSSATRLQSVLTLP